MKPLADTIKPGLVHMMAPTGSDKPGLKKPRLGTYSELDVRESIAPESLQPHSGVVSTSKTTVLQEVAGRALGALEGASRRLETSDPELSRELSSLAQDLWHRLGR